MNTPLLERLKNSPQLPSLPAVAMQVLDLARREDARIADIAKLIQNDVALSTKILRTVNSSFYGLPKQVSTISHALVILGLQSVKTLALGFSLLASIKSRKGDNFDYELFWRRSIYSAVSARLLARKVNLPEIEEAFICALLADMGSLVMHRVMGDQYDKVYARAHDDQLQLVQLCRATFDLDHAQVGGMLAETWGMPPLLAEPIRRHHSVDEAPLDLRKLAEVVYCGVLCGQVFAVGHGTGTLGQASAQLTERFNLSSAQITALLTEIHQHTLEMSGLFDLNLGAGRSYQDIMSEATQVLSDLTLHSHQQIQTAQQQNTVLQQLASTDALTGCANRGRFAAFLQEQFSRATTGRHSLAVIFVDADHFKSINDTRGHQAGDEVLRCLGHLLRTTLPPGGLAARYGGEEFALILPQTDAAAAGRQAETLRGAIQALRIVHESRPIPLTVSLGVAATDAQATFANPGQLIAAADRAVYAAKQGGRNCVRIFCPQVPAAVA